MARLKKVKNCENFVDAQALNQMIPVEACLPNCEIETKLNFRDERWMRNVENIITLYYFSRRLSPLTKYFEFPHRWKWWSHSPREVMKLLAWVSPVTPTSAMLPRRSPIRLPCYNYLLSSGTTVYLHTYLSIDRPTECLTIALLHLGVICLRKNQACSGARSLEIL